MSWISWILTVLFIMVLFILATELGSRWYLRRRGLYYVWPPYLKFLFHLDREVFPELEEQVRIEINRDGERGNEPPLSDVGLYRILVAGGSPAECASLDQTTSWPGALERILNKPEHLCMLGASKVQVGNIARSGVGSQELDIIFEKVLPRYGHLDAIVILVGGNDVFHWLQRGAQAPYRPSAVPMADVFSYHPEGPFGWKPKTLAFKQLISKQWRSWRRPIKERKRAGRWMGAARAMRASAKEMRTLISDPEDMLANFERNFRRIVQNAKAHADRVLVVRQPWFEKNYTPEEAAHIWHGGMGDPWKGENVTIFYSLDVLCKLMKLMDNRAAKVATELGVDCLDLMAILEQGLKTFFDFVHFTPAGAAVVAEVVASALLQPKSMVLG